MGKTFMAKLKDLIHSIRKKLILAIGGCFAAVTALAFLAFSKFIKIVNMLNGLSRKSSHIFWNFILGIVFILFILYIIEKVLSFILNGNDNAAV